MNFFLKHGILFLSATVLAVSTIVVPTVLVQDKEGAKEVWYGFPFHFVARDFGDIAQKSFFPRYFGFFENNHGVLIAKYSVVGFFFSLLAFYALLELVIMSLEQLKRFFGKGHL